MLLYIAFCIAYCRAKGPGPDRLGFGLGAKGPGPDRLGFGLGGQGSWAGPAFQKVPYLIVFNLRPQNPKTPRLWYVQIII